MYFYAFAHDMTAKALCFRTVRPHCSFVRSPEQILLPRYLMNGLSNLDETYSEYSIAPIEDLVRFWISKVKCQGQSRLSRWRMHPRRHPRFPVFRTSTVKFSQGVSGRIRRYGIPTVTCKIFKDRITKLRGSGYPPPITVLESRLNLISQTYTF